MSTYCRLGRRLESDNIFCVKSHIVTEDLLSQELQKMYESDSFFYSQSFDLTNTIQRQHASNYNHRLPLCRRCDERFFWNRHLVQDLIDMEVIYVQYVYSFLFTDIIVSHILKIIFQVKIQRQKLISLLFIGTKWLQSPNLTWYILWLHARCLMLRLSIILLRLSGCLRYGILVLALQHYEESHESLTCKQTCIQILYG